MRSDGEVLIQIREWAESWDNVRAVAITGSRSDAEATLDVLSDFDIEVFVRDVEPILRDDAWLDPFGTVVVRWPLSPKPTFDDRWITQLVVFDDYVRIDFQFTASVPGEITRHAGPFTFLVDKDQTGSLLRGVSEVEYLQDRPSAGEFQDRLNAYWWDIPYVAKELRRGNLRYARYILDGTIRYDKLLPMLHWYVGATLGWDADMSMYRQWMECLLTGPCWEHYLETASGPTAEESWTALYRSIELVRDVGKSLADSLECAYPHAVDESVTHYIQWIQNLDPDQLK